MLSSSSLGGKKIERSRRPGDGRGRRRRSIALAAVVAASGLVLGYAAPVLALVDADPAPVEVAPTTPPPEQTADPSSTDPGIADPGGTDSPGATPNAPTPSQEPTVEPPLAEEPGGTDAPHEVQVPPIFAAPKTAEKQSVAGLAGPVVALGPVGSQQTGGYQNLKDNSNPATWSWKDPATIAQASEITAGTFSSNIVGTDLVIKFVRPNATGSNSFAFEYTNAPERWGPAGATTLAVPQPDRSQGGQVIFIEQQGSANPVVTYCTYPPNGYVTSLNSPSCVALAGVIVSIGTTVELKIPLSTINQGSPGCPPTMGTTAYLRSFNNASAPGSNLGIWAAPIAFEPPSTCATLTLTKQVSLQYAATGTGSAPADWTLTATGQGPVAGQTVTGNGTVTRSDVKAGTYLLSESSNPGFALKTDWACTDVTDPANPMTVALTNGNSLTLAEKRKVSCVIVNTDKPGAVTWTKTDDQSPAALLGGSEWTVTTSPGGIGVGTVITDCTAAVCATGAFKDQDPAAGKFTLTGLVWGGYVLTETAAPQGHDLATPAKTVQFTVDAGNAGTTIAGPAVVNAREPGAVKWSKVDDQTPAALLGGSEWTVVGPGAPEPGMTVVDCAAAGCTPGPFKDVDPTAGEFELAGLAWGTYTVTETRAPVGHSFADPKTFTFTVDAEGAGTVIDGGAHVNPRLPGEVTWSKVDEGGELLTGSEWTLTGPGVPTGTVVTDCTQSPCIAGDFRDQDPGGGEFQLTGLAWGEYTLVESKPPAGYYASPAVHPFTIDAENLVIDLDPVVNTRIDGPELPMSGGVGRDLFTALGLGALLLGAAGTGAIAIRNHRRKEA